VLHRVYAVHYTLALMLTESQVIDAVCAHLRKSGWRIESTCRETERGYDIVATHRSKRRRAIIEAKDETSSKSYTLRHGKPFSSGQATSHISRALYTAIRSIGHGTLSGMAFPKNEAHVKRVECIAPTLRKLDLEVFWVTSDRKVERAGYWKHES